MTQLYQERHPGSLRVTGKLSNKLSALPFIWWCRLETGSVLPPVRYAQSGDVAIAYQVTGEGNPIDVVYAPGTSSHLALAWELAPARRTAERLSSFARLIRFDKRGTGMSDRITSAATLEERTDDIRAVMDAAGSQTAVLLGASEGGSMACAFAAQHPERTRGLIVWGCQATWVKRLGHPWGYEPKRYESMVKSLRDNWPSRDYVRGWGAGLGPDAPEEAVEDFLRYIQASASPAAIVALEEMNGQIDIRDILPSIRVPTLILMREHDPIVSIDAVRAMADQIPEARVVVFPGASHGIAGPGLDPEPVYAVIEEFVTGAPPATRSDRFLVTILVVDIARSLMSTTGSLDATWHCIAGLRSTQLAMGFWQLWTGRPARFDALSRFKDLIVRSGLPLGLACTAVK